MSVNGGSFRHNGKFGVTLQQERSKLDIRDCSVQDNRFWGLTIDSGASAVIYKCNISYNKCGGIHCGYNFDGDIKIAQCVVLFQSGKGLPKSCRGGGRCGQMNETACVKVCALGSK